MIKIFCLVLSLGFAASAANLKMDLGKSASVEIPVVARQSKNTFQGAKPCSKMGASKCLDIRWSIKNEMDSLIPAALIDRVDEDELKMDLIKLSKNTSVQNEKTDKFAWGSVSFWSAGSTHYFYLIPADRTYSLRIGPFSDALLVNFDFQFAKAQWKFKD